jgi:hypothetical protein
MLMLVDVEDPLEKFQVQLPEATVLFKIIHMQAFALAFALAFASAFVFAFAYAFHRHVRQEILQYRIDIFGAMFALEA